MRRAASQSSGGGPIGCAFAQFFARLGTTVTLLQDAPEVLRNDDPDVGRAVREALERDGVTVVLDADVRQAKHDGDATVLVAETPHGARNARCDVVLLATNRRPRVDSLDLRAGEIDGDRNRGVVVDGDAAQRLEPARVRGGRRARAARVGAQRRVRRTPRGDECVRRRAARRHSGIVGSRMPLYTQPQVAIVGLTERECRARGIEVRVATLLAGEVGKALVADQTDGFVKMLARPDGRVVGIALVLDDAIDLAGEAIALIDRGATAREIAAMPHLHPT